MTEDELKERDRDYRMARMMGLCDDTGDISVADIYERMHKLERLVRAACADVPALIAEIRRLREEIAAHERNEEARIWDSEEP
jgi:hypothetical protein